MQSSEICHDITCFKRARAFLLKLYFRKVSLKLNSELVF